MMNESSSRVREPRIPDRGRNPPGRSQVRSSKGLEATTISNDYNANKNVRSLRHKKNSRILYGLPEIDVRVSYPIARLFQKDSTGNHDLS